MNDQNMPVLNKLNSSLSTKSVGSVQKKLIRGKFFFVRSNSINSDPIRIKDEPRSVFNSNWSDGLPYEIMLKIFKFYAHDLNGDLKKLENLKVCKNWLNVASDNELWYSLNMSKLFNDKFSNEFSMHKKSIDTPTKTSQCMILKFEKELNKFFKRTYDPCLNLSKFSFIVKLNLSYLGYLTADMLDEILVNCKALLKLNLTHCKKLNISKKNIVFERSIADRCPNLTSLNLTGLDVFIFLIIH
jgi:hypothetical protein